LTDAKDKLRQAEAKIAALIHDTDFDPRIKQIFQTSRAKTEKLPVDPLALDRAINGVYAAFSWRELSSPFDYCDCCISEAMAKHWQSCGLSDLDPDDLWAVMSNVPPTAGTAEDVLYFAPRMLEHAAREHCILDMSHVFSSLQKEDAPQPTAAERNALREFFKPIWIGLRDTHPFHSLGVANIVLPTAVLTGDIASFLDLWLGSAALKKLVMGPWLHDNFWYPKGKAYGQFMAWLRNHGQIT
jgi:hypothetical protein